MTADASPLPLLRFRDGDNDDYFEHPVTIIGHIVFLEADTMTINEGRDKTVELYVEDFEDVLGGGDPDLMMSILLDAAEHDDLVKIVLSHTGLSYTNEKQLARAEGT